MPVQKSGKLAAPATKPPARKPVQSAPAPARASLKVVQTPAKPATKVQPVSATKLPVKPEKAVAKEELKKHFANVRSLAAFVRAGSGK